MRNDVAEAVEKHRNLIWEAEKYIWENPETGYKEYKTSAYMAAEFEKLGYELTYADGITGFYTEIDTGREGPTVLVLAELDSVICSAHPESNKETGAVHACGHHAQCAAMLGVAGALKDEGILSKLCGKIRLCCVPAEECIEQEYRETLRNAGKIQHLGGKVEFLSRGYFDGVDIAFMVHTGAGKTASVNYGGDDGFIVKTVTYKGKTAHAACGANFGKNALYAAMNGLSATNALRETFVDDDKVRWHPIITHGGEAVNNIPDKVVVESSLRAGYFEVLEKENEKINRALIGAAISFGCQIEIKDEFGYAPLKNDESFSTLAKEAFNALDLGLSCGWYGQGRIGGGCTDMGDLSALMPVIHPYIGGAIGRGHGEDYRLVDKELACITNAKWQVAIIISLLEKGAKKAKDIIQSYQPPFKSREALLEYKAKFKKQDDRIIYCEGGKIEIVL